MAILIIGIVVFFGMHLVSATPLKKVFVEKTSATFYKTGYALVSLVGLLLIIVGKANAPFEQVWNGVVQLRSFALPLMWLSFILLPAAHMKGNIKRFTRHPMLWGISLWAVVHLSVNGDLASILLFGSFLLYSLFAMVSQNFRGAQKQHAVMPVKYDLIVIAAGTTVFLGILFLHGILFGVPLWS
ncbi:MAG: NnrU family protein [Reinekea sp.]|nr:NnrU family protein [Reinekea sp.]